MRISIVIRLAAITAVVVSCGKTPTTPTNVRSQPQPTTRTVAVAGSASLTPGQTSHLTATATLTDGSIVNVSTSAQWSSSDESIVRVSAAGVATAGGIGDADIAAVYQGVRSNVLPVAVRRPDPALTVSGTIHEAGGGRPLSGVTVKVYFGPTALTDDNGRYSLEVPANSGAFLTFSKDGFEPSNARVIFQKSGETTVDATLQPSIAISAGEVLNGTLFPDDPLYQLPTIDGDEYFCSPCKVVRVTTTADGLLDVHLSDSSDDLLRIYVSDGKCTNTCLPEPPLHVTSGQDIKVYVGPKGYVIDPLRFQLITLQRQE
jgi:Carboxypeptidase regulatory-like domain